MNKLIAELRAIKGLQITCPSCDEVVPISKVRMYDMYAEMDSRVEAALAVKDEGLMNRLAEAKSARARLRKQRKEKPAMHEMIAGAVNFGKIAEKIVPSFDGYPFARSDCRAIFDPIDYLVFDGFARGNLKRIRFLDVKTGNANLNKHQRIIRDAIRAGKVKHRVVKGKDNE